MSTGMRKWFAEGGPFSHSREWIIQAGPRRRRFRAARSGVWSGGGAHPDVNLALCSGSITGPDDAPGSDRRRTPAPGVLPERKATP